MKNKTVTSICKQCGKQYDKNETGRIYGTHFIDLPYCSAICYTKAQTSPTPLEVNEGKHTPGNLQEANRELLEAMQGFIDNVIHDKKIYDNQLCYYKGIFRKAISKHSKQTT